MENGQHFFFQFFCLEHEKNKKKQLHKKETIQNIPQTILDLARMFRV